jgi:hypothetical protein
MALVVKDRVKESSTTTGTGTYTLAGAETGFQTFAVIGNGNTTYYAATAVDGSGFEVGIGTYTASGTTLARTTILSSSNSNNEVSWGAGEKLITCVQPADKVNMLDADGKATGTSFAASIDLNPVAAPSHAEGRVFYDSTRDSLAYYNSNSAMTIHAGQDTVLRVYNNSGGSIAAGSPVYLTGETGAVPTIAKATASGTLDQAYAVGVLPTAIADSSFGFVVTGGIVFFDTSGLTAGERVHVGVTAGTTQVDAPSYPNYATDLGLCLLSSASNGCVYIEIGHDAFEVLRVTGNSHFGADVTVAGDLTVLGTQTVADSNNIAISGAFNYLNRGDTIGDTNTGFSGTGLDDGVLTGHYTGTASNKVYYVQIDSSHGNEDTFKWSNDNFTTTLGSNITITGNDQALSDGISIKFNATSGHTVGDKWTGTANPTNVDTGVFSNRNTGTSGVGFTHVGWFFDVSDGQFKFLSAYAPNPTGTIDLTDSSVAYATIKAGTFIGALTGAVTGNVTGNLTGDVSGSVTGNVTGNLTGNVTGDTAGTHTGAVTGNVTGNLSGNVTSTGSNSFGTVALGDWTITEDGNGKLSFAHSGTVKMTVDDTGTIAVANDVLTDETF